MIDAKTFGNSVAAEHMIRMINSGDIELDKNQVAKVARIYHGFTHNLAQAKRGLDTNCIHSMRFYRKITTMLYQDHRSKIEKSEMIPDKVKSYLINVVHAAYAQCDNHDAEIIELRQAGCQYRDRCEEKL
jgi:hypothetical protein